MVGLDGLGEKSDYHDSSSLEKYSVYKMLLISEI